MDNCPQQTNDDTKREELATAMAGWTIQAAAPVMAEKLKNAENLLGVMAHRLDQRPDLTKAEQSLMDKTFTTLHYKTNILAQTASRHTNIAVGGNGPVDHYDFTGIAKTPISLIDAEKIFGRSEMIAEQLAEHKGRFDPFDEQIDGALTEQNLTLLEKAPDPMKRGDYMLLFSNFIEYRNQKLSHDLDVVHKNADRLAKTEGDMEKSLAENFAQNLIDCDYPVEKESLSVAGESLLDVRRRLLDNPDNPPQNFEDVSPENTPALIAGAKDMPASKNDDAKGIETIPENLLFNGLFVSEAEDMFAEQDKGREKLDQKRAVFSQSAHNITGKIKLNDQLSKRAGISFRTAQQEFFSRQNRQNRG